MQKLLRISPSGPPSLQYNTTHNFLSPLGVKVNPKFLSLGFRNHWKKKNPLLFPFSTWTQLVMAAALHFRPSAGGSAAVTPAAAGISRKPTSVNGGSCRICRCSMESGVPSRAWVAMKESRSGSRSAWFHTDAGAKGNGFSVAAKSFEGGGESGDGLEEKPTVRLNRRQRSSGLSGGNAAAVAGLLPGNPDLLTIPGVGPRNLKKLVEKGIGRVAELKQIYKDKFFGKSSEKMVEFLQGSVGIIHKNHAESIATYMQDKDQFLLSIWFDKIPAKTIVWYGYDGNTVPRGAKVDLTADRGLVLTDSQDKELWKTGSALSEVSNGFMNDTGNFELVGSDSSKSWESFSNPTDTLLPTQIMERNGVLYSRLSETNFTRGRFQLRLLEDGNLVLNTRDIPTNNAYDAYYISGTRDEFNTSNSGFQVRFNESGYMYILRKNGQRFDLTASSVLPSSANYHRATLHFDGVFVQYYHPKNFSGRPNWTAVWTQPDNICVNIGGDKGSGACGFNSVCTPDDNKRPICECPKGYSLLDPDDKYGSCKPSFIQNCDYNGSSSAEDLYDFDELIQTDWPTSDYEQLMPISEPDCRRYCLDDCFCAVTIYRGNSCWKKKLPLSNGRKDSSVNGKAMLKYLKRNLPPQSPGDCPIYREKKDQGTLIVVGSVLLGSSVFVNLVLVGAACLGFFCIYPKKTIKRQPDNSFVVETSLRCFTYEELAEATNGFKEELGRGAFGIVYKGVIQTSSTTVPVAVKKLDRVVQDGDKEFKTEVNVIAQTHHKNLVRLLGFCEDGEHRLLVYQYMSNGTLASFVFGDVKPSWTQRSHIALGIARGLAYLHDECNTQIIHCDIKPQNILLDDYYNARISDFGLAKLLMINQSRTNTAIRGTKGYVAPDWFRHAPITVKVDVYSFGVLLLEIICCRRSLEDLDFGEGERSILTDWVWDCFQDGRLVDLVDHEKEAILNEWDKLERFVMVGIWCIQDDPSLRPNMRKVSQMLEGVVDVIQPPCPSPYSFSSG